MNKEIYDIFISYRREGGFETANLIYEKLNSEGYTISFDVDNLRSGNYEDNLYSRIEQCSDFLLVVDSHCFDKMIDPSEEEDWVRNELSYAIKLKKNIIPIRLEDVKKYPDEAKLPDDVKPVLKQNDVYYVKRHVPNLLKDLKSYLWSHPRKSDDSLLPNLKVETNLRCKVFVDGRDKGTAEVEDLKMIPLKKGQYQLKFVSDLNQKDTIKDNYLMPDEDRIYSVDLLSIQAQREEKEREQREERRRIKEEARKKKEEAKREKEQKRKEEEERKQKEEERLRKEDAGEFCIEGVNFKMVYVEGGSFMMGATDGDQEAYPDERPAHMVLLDDYYIGETVVTQKLWKAVMGVRESPFPFKSDDNPVERISWYECQEFIKKLNEKTRRTFRLPTEAEWEFAARGGNKSKGFKYSGSNDINEVAWYWQNSGDKILEGTDVDWDHVKIKKNNSKTHPVGQKKPNELSLYDMSGNISEWCNDRYDIYSADPQTNPEGPKEGGGCVIRGGGWNSSAKECRVSCRLSFVPGVKYFGLGFRLALDPESTTER